MATIFDVAKEAGVSKSTVSRVVNNDECVKKETRDAVNAAIKKLNYSPSFMAQAIRTRKTHTIAFMIPEYSNIYYAEMFRGVEDIALEHGYMVLVCNTQRHALSEVEYVQELLKRSIDGIIYNTYRINDEMAEYLRLVEQKIPVVYTNKPILKDRNVPHVYTDGLPGTQNAVRYLHKKGKRKIGYVLDSEEINVITERFYGYLQGLEECGLPRNEDWIYRIHRGNEPNYIDQGRDAAKYYVSLHDRPDAILTAIDMLGIGCVRGFHEAGIKMPEEMSVIGFDNIFLSSLIEPPLTTIGQPIREMGQAAAKMLISMVEGKECRQSVIFQGDLIIRGTA